MGDVDGGFLYQHVLSDAFVEFLKPRMSGSNYPAVKKDDVEAYTLSVPPLPEQRKIAAILSSVDDAIEKTQAVIDQVQVVKRGLMQELLTRGLPGRHTRFKQTEIGEIPEKWSLATLSQLADVRRGASPRPIRDQKWFSVEGPGWVRIVDVTRSDRFLRSTDQALSKLEARREQECSCWSRGSHHEHLRDHRQTDYSGNSCMHTRRLCRVQEDPERRA